MKFNVDRDSMLFSTLFWLAVATQIHAGHPVLPALPLHHDTTDLKEGYSVALELRHDVHRLGELARRTQGSVGVENVHVNKRYTLPVTLGKPLDGQPVQTYACILDTGSSDFWVYGPNMPSGTPTHKTYDPAKDALTPASNDPDSSQYWQGNPSWKIVFYDNTNLAGTSCSTTQVSWGSGDATFALPQTILVASSVEPLGAYDDGNDPIDGLIGLGSKPQDLKKADGSLYKRTGSLFQNLISSKLLNHASIGFYLPLDGAGTADFDYNDADHRDLSDGIHWVSMDPDNDLFSVPMTGIQFGTDGKTTFEQSTILDTGSTMFQFDTDSVKAYYSNIDSAKVMSPCSESNWQWLVADSATGDLRDLSLWLGHGSSTDADENKVTVPGSLINWSGSTITGWTIAGVQERPATSENVLGTLFFNAYYVVFNMTAGNEKLYYSRIKPS